MFAIYLKSGLVSSIWVQPSSRSALPQITTLTSLSKADISLRCQSRKAGEYARRYLFWIKLIWFKLCKFMLNPLYSPFNWTSSFYLPLQLYIYLHMVLINIWFAIQSDRQTGNTIQTGNTRQTGITSQRGKTWFTFKLDFPGRLCWAGFAILAMLFIWLHLYHGFHSHFLIL